MPVTVSNGNCFKRNRQIKTGKGMGGGSNIAREGREKGFILYIRLNKSNTDLTCIEYNAKMIL